MTCAEFKRWLRSQGCTFVEGRRHTKVMLNGRVSLLPRHPSLELKSGTVQGILRALDLKGK